MRERKNLNLCFPFLLLSRLYDLRRPGAARVEPGDPVRADARRVLVREGLQTGGREREGLPHGKGGEVGWTAAQMHR